MTSETGRKVEEEQDAHTFDLVKCKLLDRANVLSSVSELKIKEPGVKSS